ncbi:hypothetical protein M5K25_002683 [Dendrobium thyrsiflorum]|uniref:Uncharacterized protein n=1 Tax=Dendrobium thyrsiflorum TaxID=117978 RepID=A0ABD0VND2_DENTH
MVRDVPTSRVAGNKNKREIPILEKGIGMRGESLGSEPKDGGEGIVNCGREAIFGCETVVGGDDDCAEIGGEAEAVVVEIGPSAGSDAEAAAMEVEEDGEFGGVGWEAVARAVEAEIEVKIGIKDGVSEFYGSIVFDGHDEAWFGASKDGAVVEEAEDATALFDYEDFSRPRPGRLT